MERPNKSRSLFLKFLPKPTTFQNPPFSPGRDHHHHSSTKLKAQAHKGFSGPINFSSLPDEARSKPKIGSSFDAREPTSPKVSCMGQIKYKHKNKKKKKLMMKKSPPSINTKKSSSAIGRFFSRSSPKTDLVIKKSDGYQCSDHDNNARPASTPDHKKTPSLGHMKKFVSGRESLANFDWTAQIAPIDHDRDCYSDEERVRDSDDDEEEDIREIIIPFSAPILVSGREGGGLGLKPRKEVNIWRRRTLAPPPPLALNNSKVRS